MKNALIIFQKNPTLGKVKTRLAATVGDENAMKIYKVLVEHTHTIVAPILAKKYLYFSDYIDEDGRWNDYSRKVQKGDDLGLRMFHALQEVRNEGAERVVVIGTDCYELSTEIIENAFEKLENADYCIGPALDGGYYLIGTSCLDKAVFIGKEWSTENVFQEAKTSIESLGKTLHELPVLSDVDYEEDLKSLVQFLD